MLVEETREFLHDLAAVRGLRLVHAEHHAADLERRVEALREDLDRLEQLREALHREELRLHRHHDLVGEAEAVERQHAEARRAVDQHEVELAADLLEALAEDAVAVGMRRKLGLGAREVGGRREQPEVVAHLDEALADVAVGLDERVVDGLADRAAVDAEMERQVRLRIEVDEERAPAEQRDRRADAHR